MRLMKPAVRLVALTFVLAATASVCARETGTAIGARPLPSVPCKNHYILDEPCDDAVRALDAQLEMPGAIAVDGDGNVLFSSPNIVYKIDRAGMLRRVAGNGVAGFSGDGGPARDALLNFPATYPELEADPFDYSELLGPLALDRVGNLYIGDAYNNRVRRVTPEGIIDTVIGGLWWPQGVGVDGAGNLFVADSTGTLFKRGAGGGVASLTAHDCGSHLAPGLCAPQGIAVDAAGEVFATDIYCRVRKIDPNGAVRTVAGDERPDPTGNTTWTCGYSGDGGPATLAALSWPFAVALDGSGNLFIADTYNHCIRKVAVDGIITTLAGRCGVAGDSSGEPAAVDALLDKPHGVAVDTQGNVYIADTGNHRIRKVTIDGIITTIAGASAKRGRLK